MARRGKYFGGRANKKRNKKQNRCHCRSNFRDCCRLLIILVAFALWGIGAWRKNSKEDGPPISFISETLPGENSSNVPTTATVHPTISAADAGPPPPKTIAYVVPLFQLYECGRTTNEVILEAAMVLRHSIHLQSSRTPISGSIYDYQMYALVLESKNCPLEELQELGYLVHKVASPIVPAKIPNLYLQNTLQRAAEIEVDGSGLHPFIQLLAHDLVQEPIFVCLYLNSLVTKPMDPLFSAMHYPKDHPRGEAARSFLLPHLEDGNDILPLPDRIDHFFVRDYPNAGYGRKPVIHRGGFWVARKNPNIKEEAIRLVYQGNYREGNEVHQGWGGKGYSLYYAGGMTMPGLYAYLLDQFHSDTSVELSGCQFNHNGMDNLFRAPPRYHPDFAKHHVGECRSAQPSCGGDCTTTDPQSIFHILYDHTCFQPWRCVGEGDKGDSSLTKVNTETTTLEHCLVLNKQWHLLRKDIESKLGFAARSVGNYKPESFLGHCSQPGEFASLWEALSEDDRKRIPERLWVLFGA